MKKLLCTLSLILSLILLVPSAAFAAGSADDGIYAEATTLDGDAVVLADAPDVDRIGDLESYDLIIGDEPVLTVEQSDIPDITAGTVENGYFSADFFLPDTQKRVFLVGLSADKVEEIQSRIISSYASGADFELEDLSFIDAEKVKINGGNGDDNLCWAAAASNVLTYTGWAAQAGFAATDDVFEAFISAFTDNGGNASYGFSWFFNGVNVIELLFPGQFASAAAGTGGYLTDYAYERLADTVDISAGGIRGMSALHRCLEDGKGIALSVSIYNSASGAYYGGHALTCWGFIADMTYSSDDPGYYAGLFITDSDSDQPSSGDRRDAKNILQSVSLSNGTDANGALTFEFDLDRRNRCVIDEFDTLIPYSPDVEKETDSAATRDRAGTTDLTVLNIFLNTDLTPSDVEVRMEKIESNTPFYYTPSIKNESYVDFSFSRTKISFEITDADGQTAFSNTFKGGLTIPPGYSVSYGTSLINNDGLPAGDYIVTASVNADKAVAEAYCYNNTASYPLKVRDSYLLGDTDGSGEVDIIDATKIQRIAADYDEGYDDLMRQRASVIGGELSVLESTLIQRYIADYEIRYPVGEKRLYE